MGGTSSPSQVVTWEPFTLLLHVLQNNGTPVPPSWFTTLNTVELVQHVMGALPINMEVVMDHEAIVELNETMLAVGVAQQMQGSMVWGHYVTEVTWLLSGRDSVMSIIRERETARDRLKALEDEWVAAVQQQVDEKAQFMKMLEEFGEEVRKVEDLKKWVERSMTGLHQEAISTTAALERPDQELIQLKDVIRRQPPLTYGTEAYTTLKKLTKTPNLPPFSGTDPVPKDEGSWEQWEFQVKGFLDTHTQEAIQVAIVHSV